jgi:hypothetical protein
MIDQPFITMRKIELSIQALIPNDKKMVHKKRLFGQNGL